MNAKDHKELAGEAGQLVGGLIECFAISCMSVNIMDAFLSPDSNIYSSFYGITITQANMYFHTCERDPKWMKWMAAIVTYEFFPIHSILALTVMITTGF